MPGMNEANFDLIVNESALKIIDEAEFLVLAEADWELLSRALLSCIGALAIKTGKMPSQIAGVLTDEGVDWDEAHEIYRRRHGESESDSQR